MSSDTGNELLIYKLTPRDWPGGHGVGGRQGGEGGGFGHQNHNFLL